MVVYAALIRSSPFSPQSSSDCVQFSDTSTAGFLPVKVQFSDYQCKNLFNDTLY